MDHHGLVSIFHILFVIPLFLFVGFRRADTPEWLYNVLFGLGILIGVYHSVKAMIRWHTSSQLLWVNLLHVLIVVPLLLWIGFLGKKTERPAYELLLIAGFGALGYHLKNLLFKTPAFTKADD
jgi:hypothetical protein